MTNEEYQQYLEQIVLLAGMIRLIPLKGFLDRISMAETLGPLLDPTLYSQAGANLATIREMASRLYEIQRWLDILQEKIS